jgi:hypothetical protein
MTRSIPFEVKPGVQQDAQADYLPYGTRTLAFEVTNSSGQPLKLWLRPACTPEDYPQQVIYGYGGGPKEVDQELLVHWAGGDELGACVKMDEKSPLRDRSLKAWEVVPVPLESGETRRVYLNLTHLSGALKPRKLVLTVHTDGDQGAVVGSRLDLRLNPPELDSNGEVVQGVWETNKQLAFKGSHIPDYVSRWWPEQQITYTPDHAVAGDLSIQLTGRKITLQLAAATNGNGITLAEVNDLDWKRSLDQVHQLRPLLPELFHLCNQRFYVVRLWFLWLDKRIGKKHEVPDAERFDVLFDAQEGAVRYMGTDFHYHETWGQLEQDEKYARASLGLNLFNLDDFGRTLLSGLLESAEGNPISKIELELCQGLAARQTGPNAHVPLLRNAIFWQRLTSGDVRQL